MTLSYEQWLEKNKDILETPDINLIEHARNQYERELNSGDENASPERFIEHLTKDQYINDIDRIVGAKYLHQKGIISEDAYTEFLSSINVDRTRCMMYLDKEERQRVIELNKQVELGTILANTDDFDNIPFEKVKDYSIDDWPINIIQALDYKAMFKAKPSIFFVNRRIRRHKPFADFIDEALLDGNIFQPKDYIKEFRDSCTVYSVVSWIYKYACVDFRILLSLYDVIKQMPSLANKLATLKKVDMPFDCIDGDTTAIKESEDDVKELTGDYSFRFSKNLRRLFKCWYLCTKKEIAKTREASMKEDALLCQLYNYDPQMIFESICSEELRLYSQPRKEETEEQEIL